MTEDELIKKCQRGSRSAQEQLYARYADRLYRLAYRYIKSDTDAEDVIMLSFAKVFSSIGSFVYRGEGCTEGWMRRIVVNEALMWLRKKHNFNLTESLDATLQEPDLQPYGQMDAEDVYQFVLLLPTGYRTVFNLSVIEGYNHAEIAALLQINENTSRSQLFKAKTLLKKMLTREGYHYGT
ncbi:MAG TPA: sigma-70 family RNA polymerase sigma factor [Ohtaekwangia sp.]|uniref:RNA polymerase sigma factor n=1 Tax=Ohtaekwangia sp. TaxID=2066019 RepID=UPI002F930C42